MSATKVVQGSVEWMESRLGRVTASRLVDVLAKLKTGEAAARANYRAELVAERLTGKAAESFTNAAMKWGTDCEPLARAAYEAEFGVLVDEVGMIQHPSIEWQGLRLMALSALMAYWKSSALAPRPTLTRSYQATPPASTSRK